MVSGNVFGINNTRAKWGRVDGTVFSRIFRGHCASGGADFGAACVATLIMLHFEPNKLSLQCSLCGYETEGWEVGRPMTARRQANNPQARPDRRRHAAAAAHERATGVLDEDLLWQI